MALNESKIKDSLLKAAMQQAKVNDCCSELAQDSQVPSLTEQLKTERARVSKQFTARIRKLDQAIRLLESSDAEAIIKDAQSTLFDC